MFRFAFSVFPVERPECWRRVVRRSAAWGRAGLALLLLWTAGAPVALAARCPDLALVLALDASGSVNDAEFRLQMQGYADAFRSPSVQDAIMSAGQVQVAMVVWADGEMSSQVLPFQDVSNRRAAEAFAQRIDALDRRVTGNTGIGRGLWTALDLIALDMSCAPRRLVNVSGDGAETMIARARENIALNVARMRAAAMGVTVNGLAIQTSRPDLAEWYGRNLVTGPGAFVMSVSTLASFSEAINAKLVREISVPLLAADKSGPIVKAGKGFEPDLRSRSCCAEGS